jgi:GNAT superfamily N-acetyltransferase
VADVSVRPASADDVAEIARIHVETWRFGYAGILPAPVLDGLTVDAAAAAWREAVLEPPSPRHHVLVAVEGRWIVGFAALGPADDLQPDDADQEATVSIGPVVVEPRWARRGHGSRLMAAAVDVARGDGMTRAVSWIPEQDTVSREFLAGGGWAPDGLARALDTGAGELREIRLHAALDEPPAAGR